MTFGFIICVYVGILVLAMLVRGRQSGDDFLDGTLDEPFECEVHPGVYDEQIKQLDRRTKEDIAADGKLHGII